MTESVKDPYAGYRERYTELCATRDAANALVAPLQVELDKAVAEAQEAQNKANAIATKIQEVRGGERWLSLKKEIGILAKLLSGQR